MFKYNFTLQSNNLERAGDWLLSHIDELTSAMDTDEPEEKPASGSAPSRKKYRDGRGGTALLICFIGKLQFNIFRFSREREQIFRC